MIYDELDNLILRLLENTQQNIEIIRKVIKLFGGIKRGICFDNEIKAYNRRFIITICFKNNLTIEFLDYEDIQIFHSTKDLCEKLNIPDEKVERFLYEII